MPYGDYIESIPTPSFLALTSIEPLPGTAMLQIPHKTAMLCVDRLLGGPGIARAAGAAVHRDRDAS